MKLFHYFCILLILFLFSGYYFLLSGVFPHTTKLLHVGAPSFSLLTSLSLSVSVSPCLLHSPFCGDVIQFKNGLCTDGIYMFMFMSAYLCNMLLKLSMSRTELHILPLPQTYSLIVFPIISVNCRFVVWVQNTGITLIMYLFFI